MSAGWYLQRAGQGEADDSRKCIGSHGSVSLETPKTREAASGVWKWQEASKPKRRGRGSALDRCGTLPMTQHADLLVQARFLESERMVV